MAFPFFMVFFQPAGIHAQIWRWVEAFGDEANESCRVLGTGPAGQLHAGGTFREMLDMGMGALPSFGGDDIWLAGFGEGGDLKWTVSAGGLSDDVVSGLSIDAAGHVICVGAYWEEAFFEDQVLRSRSNPKGLFVAKYDLNGRLIWVRGIDGTKLKEVGGVTSDASGNIFLAGYFEDSLLVEDKVLKASGTTDLFLIKLDEEGSLKWASSDGLTGNTRAITLALTPEEEIVVGGYFDDTTRIAGTVLTANTFDRDVFLARYDSDGRAVWARKAGGVHDDEIAAVEVDGSGQIYATGWLVGVMSLSDSISIESKTGQSDFYLLRYAADGTPLMARAMGGREQQQTTGISLTGKGAVLSGFYRGEMTIDETTVFAGNGFGSFVAHFDENAKLQWIANLPAEESLLINGLTEISRGWYFVGGDFTGEIRIGGEIFQDKGLFDFLLAVLQEPSTSTGPAPGKERGIKVYPNPAYETIHIETRASDFEVVLSDAAGRSLLRVKNEHSLRVEHLQAGLYFVRYQDRGGIQMRKVLIMK